MKKKIISALTVLLVWGGVAIASAPGNVNGEVTEIKGEMITVKTMDGAMKSFHVDPKTTKKEGMVEIGSHITAEVGDNGHANWVKAMKKEGKEVPKG